MNIERLITLSILNDDVIYETLAKSTEGIPLIDTLRVPVGDYPLIEFHQISGGDGLSADDEVYTERFTFQVSFIAEDEVFLDIRHLLKDAMREVGLRIINEYSFQNQYTNYIHYAIHVSQSYDKVWYEREIERQETIYNTKHPEVETKLPEGIYFDEDTGDEYEVYDLEDLEGLGYEFLP